MITKVRNGFLLLVAAIVAAGAYSVLGGNWPSSLERFPHRPVKVSPAPEGKIAVKFAAIIDGNRANRSHTTISVWYTINGERYPKGGPGGTHFTTKGYWWRVMALERGDQITMHVSQSNLDADPEQVVDIAMYKLDVEGREGRVLGHAALVGIGTANATGTVR